MWMAVLRSVVHSGRRIVSTRRLSGIGPIYADDGVTSNGSVFVVNFETRAEVADFIAADPFVINGVYRDWTVALFKNIWTQD